MLCIKKAKHTHNLSSIVYLLAILHVLEKEPKDFSSCVFSSGLLVVHDASWGCQNNESAENKEKKHEPLLVECISPVCDSVLHSWYLQDFL